MSLSARQNLISVEFSLVATDSMTLEQFDSHLRNPRPGSVAMLAAMAAGKLKLLARVENRIGKPATAKAIAAVTKACGASSPVLKRFVELHDGVLLYCDYKSDAAGAEFFKAAEWQLRTQRNWRESMTAMGFEEDDMPEWFHRGVVFGEIPHSANYFVIQPSGKESGQVFYCDHDDFKTEPMAASFEDLLSMIVKDPPGCVPMRMLYAVLRRED